MEKSKLLENTQRYRRTKKGILTNSYSKQNRRHAVEYSLKELHDKFMFDDKFDRIYKEWKNKGYKKELKPTIDRINCRLDYTLSNVHALTWEENRYKQRMELKFLRARPIVSVVDGEEKYRFKSVSQAVKETGIHQGNISSCLTGKRKTAGGFNWFYENPELLEA